MAAAPVRAADAPPGADTLFAAVAAEAPAIERMARDIWLLAETGFQERQSSSLLQDALRRAGFRVTAGVGGMPTAFVATFRTGEGPVIGITAEFDALPGVSQDASAVTLRPLAGKSAGHACGHNLLGAGSVGAAIVLRKWLSANKVGGESRVSGSPAEEHGAGKAYLVRDGLFKDVDAVIHWHPKDVTAVWTEPTQANIKTRFRFTGTATHAAATPERGRSALAGVEVMNAAVNAMRQFTPDGTRIHGVIASGGEVPNVVPAFASSLYYVRNHDVTILRALQDRLVKAADGAAIATETKVDWDVEGGVYPLLINDTLARVAQASLEEVLPHFDWTPEERRYAAGVQASLGVSAGTDIQPAGLVLDARPVPGSTDVGDISFNVPTVGVFIAAWPRGTPAHSWASAGASGSSIGMKSAVIAANVVAQTAARLFGDPALLAEARTELERRRGADFTYRALFGDRQPPLEGPGS